MTFGVKLATNNVDVYANYIHPNICCGSFLRFYQVLYLIGVRQSIVGHGIHPLRRELQRNAQEFLIDVILLLA